MACPAGTFSNTTSATSCTLCPAATPYSTAGATSCSACTSGCDGPGSSYGKYACPGTDWTAWYDATGVETANSCIKYYSDTKTWTESRDACLAAATGSHLLSSRQVSLHALPTHD